MHHQMHGPKLQKRLMALQFDHKKLLQKVSGFKILNDSISRGTSYRKRAKMLVRPIW
jgi:hypothetical protein